MAVPERIAVVCMDCGESRTISRPSRGVLPKRCKGCFSIWMSKRQHDRISGSRKAKRGN